jgi:RimJ/RimL family protein N-acetyltransferase
MIKTLAFNTLGLNRLFTETFTYRSEQIRILKYFGMGIEGVLKSSYLKNGKFFNTAIQSIVNI